MIRSEHIEKYGKSCISCQHSDFYGVSCHGCGPGKELWVPAAMIKAPKAKSHCTTCRFDFRQPTKNSIICSRCVGCNSWKGVELSRVKTEEELWGTSILEMGTIKPGVRLILGPNERVCPPQKAKSELQFTIETISNGWILKHGTEKRCYHEKTNLLRYIKGII